MPTSGHAPVSAESLERLVRDLAQEASAVAGNTIAVDPGKRPPFHWPPHPVSHSYNVLRSDWHGQASFEVDGETFEVEVAETPHGVFGRCPALWHDARGETLGVMLNELRVAALPLLNRQKAMAAALGRPGRYSGTVRELGPADLLRLLYCRDRGVANDARIEIEKQASLGVFGPALVAILEDRSHPLRRTAQWCALDLFEDLPRLCPDPTLQARAVVAMRALLWDAPDDFARTVYKAGVVLGGHLPTEIGGPVLLECLRAPSRIGRRAAIHGLFHVVEWSPTLRSQVVDALRTHALEDPEAALRDYAAAMAADVESGGTEHVLEPVFPDE